MFEFRLRIPDVRERNEDPTSFLGIVEGVPTILVQAGTIGETEIALANALREWLGGLMNHEATRLQLDDFPTVRISRLLLGQPVTIGGEFDLSQNWN